MTSCPWGVGGLGYRNSAIAYQQAALRWGHNDGCPLSLRHSMTPLAQESRRQCKLMEGGNAGLDERALCISKKSKAHPNEGFFLSSL